MEEILQLLSLLSLAPVLWGVVITRGDVKPSNPGGFGLPADEDGFDDDADEHPDWIDEQGNQVFFNDVDSTNVNGGAGGLAWNDARVWADCDTPQNVFLSEFGYGYLEINGGSALRYQNLYGGVLSRLHDASGPVPWTSITGGEPTPITTFPFARIGRGILTVTGSGSVFNNAPRRIDAGLQAALNYYAGRQPGTLVADITDDVAASSGTSPTIPLTARPEDGEYDIDIDNCRINVMAGGRIEIGNRLLTGQRVTSVGPSLVVVDGIGSHLLIDHVGARADTDPTQQSKMGSRDRLIVSDGGTLAIDPSAKLVVNGAVIVSGEGNQISGPLEINGTMVLRCGATLDATTAITGSGKIYVVGNAHLNAPVSGPEKWTSQAGLPGFCERLLIPPDYLEAA